MRIGCDGERISGGSDLLDSCCGSVYNGSLTVVLWLFILFRCRRESFSMIVATPSLLTLPAALAKADCLARQVEKNKKLARLKKSRLS